MDDPCQHRRGVAEQPSRVAAAIGALVMQLDDRNVRAEERISRRMCARRRVRLDDLELFLRQRPVLLKHAVGDADLPMSCSSA